MTIQAPRPGQRRGALRWSRRCVWQGLAAVGLAGATRAQAVNEGEPVRAIAFDAIGTLFDTGAIKVALERMAPGRGKDCADIWRLKQLEYTFLSSSARHYIPLAEITRSALAYAMQSTGVSLTSDQISALLTAYGRLPCFADVKPGLAALRSKPLAIFSASGPALLDSLLDANGMRGLIQAIVSTETARSYKPSPDAYALLPAALGVPAANIMLVSSNGFDIWGAGVFGLQTAWLQRPGTEPPGSLYELLRTRQEMLRPLPGRRISSLLDLQPG